MEAAAVDEAPIFTQLSANTIRPCGLLPEADVFIRGAATRGGSVRSGAGSGVIGIGLFGCVLRCDLPGVVVQVRA